METEARGVGWGQVGGCVCGEGTGGGGECGVGGVFLRCGGGGVRGGEAVEGGRRVVRAGEKADEIRRAHY